MQSLSVRPKRPKTQEETNRTEEDKQRTCFKSKTFPILRWKTEAIAPNGGAKVVWGEKVNETPANLGGLGKDLRYYFPNWSLVIPPFCTENILFLY